MAEVSTPKTFLVALLVAVGCAGLVSLTAVGLADRIQANKTRDLMRHVLEAVELEDPEAVRFRIVELDSGRYVDPQELGPGTFEQRDAEADPTRSDPIPAEQDTAGLGRRERYAVVGLVEPGGRLEALILPVRGLGYGGLIRGFVVLSGEDLQTLRSIHFSEHEETPGLGGEITSRAWRARFAGKRVYDDEGVVRIEVVQTPDARGRRADFQVEGLSGATITSESVSELLRFWFGELGFGPYLLRLREEQAGGAGGSSAGRDDA